MDTVTIFENLAHNAHYANLDAIVMSESLIQTMQLAHDQPQSPLCNNKYLANVVRVVEF